MTAQLSLIDEQGRARQARDEGMSRALAHAEADTPSWGEIAYAWLYRYATSHERFTGFILTAESHRDKTFPQPANERAWGQVYRRATKSGVIRDSGQTMPHPRRHACKAIVWRSLVYQDAA